MLDDATNPEDQIEGTIDPPTENEEAGGASLSSADELVVPPGTIDPPN